MIIDISIHVFIFSQVLLKWLRRLVRKVYLHMSRGHTSLAGVKDDPVSGILTVTTDYFIKYAFNVKVL